MRQIYWMKGQKPIARLHPEFSLNALLLSCGSDMALKALRLVRFLIAAVGILAVTLGLSGAIVFSLFALVRVDGLTRGRSADNPMVFASGAPEVQQYRLSKASRLHVVSARAALNEGDVLAAYHRALTSATVLPNIAQTAVSVTPPKAQQDVVLRNVPNENLTNVSVHEQYAIISQSDEKSEVMSFNDTLDSGAQVPSISDSAERAVADAFAPLNVLQLPPEAQSSNQEPVKPPIDQHIKPVDAKDSNKLPLKVANRPTGLPDGTRSTEGNGALLSKRAAPDARVRDSLSAAGRGNHVAIYDISAGVVYLPDGEQLEAHSGVGRMRDNPSFAKVRMLGPTPPATYALSLREAAFHGVDAIRLTPVNGTAPFGRDGLLAHTYMLRRPGDSNGCVVFARYDRFLRAFKRNEVNFMVVVPQLQERLTRLGSSPVRG